MYLGIDCGTQGTKAMVWDSATRRVLGSGYSTYPLCSDDRGRREQDPADWITALTQSTRQALSLAALPPAAIKGIGISGQQHGLVLLDQHDVVIRPAKLWCDTEPAALLNEFIARYFTSPQPTLADVLGIHVPVAFTLAKLLWIQRHEPGNYAKIRKIMLPHEFLSFWLTGEYRSEFSDASGTGYFDTYRRCWSELVLNRVDNGRPFAMPELISSSTPFGALRPAAAMVLGLESGTLVASGGGDNMMSAIGSGNIQEGLLTMSLGTSGTLFTYTDKQIDSRAHPDINAFCSSTNGWLPLVSTMNVTNVTTAFRLLLSKSLDEFEYSLEQSEPGAGGIQCMPFLNGARLPNLPNATASLLGITTNNFNDNNLLRSVVEGVTFNLCHGIEILSRCNLQFKQVNVTGGGSNSVKWRRIIADVSGLSVVKSRFSDTGALGAALQAQWCYFRQSNLGVSLSDICLPSGLIDDDSVMYPQPEANLRYRDIYQRYQQQLATYQQQFRQS